MEFSLPLDVPAVVALIAGIVAGVTDVWKYKVYNALTIPLVVSGLFFHGIVNGGEGFLSSVVGMAFGFGILFVPFVLGGMGAGDVKLMAGVGAWLGMPTTFYVFIVTGLACGVCALLMAAFQTGGLRGALINLLVVWNRLGSFARHFGGEDWVETQGVKRDGAHRVIPFGAMVAFGVITTLVWMWWQ